LRRLTPVLAAKLAIDVIVGGLICAPLAFLMTPALIVPRSVPVIHGLIAFLALGGVRFASRLRSEKVSPARSRQIRPKRVLIVGAGQDGQSL